MNEKVTLTVAGQDVVMDLGLLVFDEVTLSQYMEKEGGYYAYFGSKLCEAEREMQRLELIYDVIYAERFKENKDAGGSDKYAESKTVADSDVVDAKRDFLESKYKVRQLQQYLRAWDRNHDNAQNRGNTLRRELDKLGGTVYGGSGGSSSDFHSLEDEVDAIIGRSEDFSDK
jgi:hypothetical protein